MFREITTARYFNNDMNSKSYGKNIVNHTQTHKPIEQGKRERKRDEKFA